MTQSFLNANWIGLHGSIQQNCTFLARRQFEMARLPQAAILQICADSRYAAYLNGQFIGTGPVKCSDKRYFFDRYNVRPFLREGLNSIAVEVHCPVISTFISVSVQPALYVQVDGIVNSDALWQVRPDPSRRSDSLLYTEQIGFSELRDMRRELSMWQTFSDASDGWCPAKEIGGAHDLGGRCMVARDIPSFDGSEHIPKTLLSHGAVPARDVNEDEEIYFADLVHSELHFQADLPSVQFSEGTLRLTPSQSGRGCYVILDFERELLGSLSLDLECPTDTIVDIGFGESLQDDRIYTKRFNYRFADRYILRAGRQRIEHRLHDRGFRMLQMVFRRFQEPVLIHSIKLINRHYPTKIDASFTCDDPFFNKLWTMCCDTITACCTDTFVDCPWREQAFWVCDTLVVTSFYHSLTSDRRLSARCFRLVADGQLASGLIPSVYPSERDSFESMSAIWAIMLYEYFLYTGDSELVRELLPILDQALGIYDQWAGADHLVPHQPGMWHFIEWGYNSDTAGLGGTSSILNLLIAAGYKCASVLHGAVGNEAHAGRMIQKSRMLVDAVVGKFWMPDKKMLYDCTEPPLGKRSFSQHPHAIGLYFDLFDEAQKIAALDALSDPSLVQAELYYQHFVLAALARHGRAEQALSVIRNLWMPMVLQKSPTVWESKRGADAFSGCGSLCHAFACAPLYFMQTTMLGVRPLGPGFSEFAFEPQCVGQACCRGAVPTPHGNIEVSWSCNGKEALSIEITVPPLTTARLKDGRSLASGCHAILLAI